MNDKSKRFPPILPAVLLTALLVLALASVSCGDDTSGGGRDLSADDDDSGGGGSDDDTDDDDGDDDTGDDDSADDDDAASPEDVLLIYRSSQTVADRLTSALEGFDYTVTLLREVDVTASKVSGYDLIVVAGDTMWSNVTNAETVLAAGTPIFGIYTGGAQLLAVADSQLGYTGESFFSAENSVAVAGPDASLWDRPNSISVTDGETLRILSSTESAYARYPNDLTGITVYGEINASAGYVVLALESDFFYWGFETDGSRLNSTGSDLFENALYLTGRQ